MPSFIKTHCDVEQHRSMSPASYHSYAAMVVCAAALTNRVYVEPRWGRIYPHLWVALIGPSGVAKSTAVNHAADLLHQANDTLELPQEFSRERFLEYLAPRPYGLIRWSEMGHGLEAISADYNMGTISLFIEMWDCRHPVKRTTKGAGDITLLNPTVSILTAATPVWFRDYFRTPKQVRGGFLGRWLFVYEDEDRGYKPSFSHNGDMPSADWHVRGSLAEHLRELTQYEGGVMEWGSGGKIIDEWAADLRTRGWNDENDPVAFSKRGLEQVTKMTIAIQASQGVSYLASLEADAAKQAIAFWEYAFKSGRRLVDELIGNTQDADELEALYRIIAQHSPIEHSVALRLSHLKAQRFRESIETLVESHRVTKDQEAQPSGKSGRPHTSYTAIRSRR